QIRDWDLSDPNSLVDLISKVNAIRHAHPALQTDRTLRFHETDNDNLIAYSKRAPGDLVLVVVNLDPSNRQAGWVRLPLDDLELEPDQAYQVHDLITEQRFQWRGEYNYVELDPHVFPAHVLRVRQRIRTEHDFEYFM